MSSGKIGRVVSGSVNGSSSMLSASMLSASLAGMMAREKKAEARRGLGGARASTARIQKAESGWRMSLLAATGAVLTAMWAVDNAAADVVAVTFQNVSPAKEVSYKLDGHNGSTYAGLFNWTRTGGDYDGGGAEGDFATFCIEMTQTISGGQNYTYNIVPVAEASLAPAGMGPEKADTLSGLWGQRFHEGMDADEAAAFQVATWEIVHDSGYDLKHGEFRVKTHGDWVALAQTWLDELDSYTGAGAELMGMANSSRQDHVFAVPGPASAALYFVGCVVMAVRRGRE